MNRTEYLLTQAASECNEVAHRITKALHFGLMEVQPGQDETNAQRIVGEFADLFGVMLMLHEEGALMLPTKAGMQEAADAKKAKVEKFFRYASEQCGTVTA